ncbi:hypothetical protein PPERSA_01738 [Pseudocohnilembus persalinus]|uniref:Uncharacterized protein n=1 Tax=Pseudocohnilembus persalinus TaxID=266149 RepID=A0A0V0R288_PSEPJ|nr:hypothetical protein PPERSA_01738 [Pseudocohnilembus persalinus]|eukprot:KRX08277.1 hypothetical protein PPERSA_01738 [Pseudocohnilembus persalinus]
MKMYLYKTQSPHQDKENNPQVKRATLYNSLPYKETLPEIDEDLSNQNLVNEIRELQETVNSKKHKATKQEDIEIIINEKTDGNTIKKLVLKNQQYEKELSRLKQKQLEYFNKFKYLKNSWEDKDDQNIQLKKKVEKLKNELNDVFIELEKEKLKNQYLDEDLLRLKTHQKQMEQKKVLVQKKFIQSKENNKNFQDQPFNQNQDKGVKVAQERIEVPVIQEKIVEKIIDRPVEVEKIVEKIVEVPIEKVVEIIKEVPENISQELNILRRDNENLCIQIEGKQREIDSMRNRLENLEQYNSQNEGARLANQEQKENLLKENENLSKKIELMYSEIKDLSYQNDIKNNSLEAHIKNLETLLRNNNIKFPELSSY